MLCLKLANLEDVRAEYEALCKLPATGNDNWPEYSLDEFKEKGITKIKDMRIRVKDKMVE